MNIASDDKVAEILPECHMELTRRRGSTEAPLRPLKPPRCASMQALVDEMDLL